MTVAADVAPGVRRVTCPNASPMTGTGTQTYLVGQGDVAVIDPGPEDAGHLAAVIDAARPGRVAAILVTHSHRDHSAGARAMAEATGAPVMAYGPHGAGMSGTMRRLAEAGGIGGGEGADTGFVPDRRLADGDVVDSGGEHLVALHTPGHIANHLCFALEGRGVLFTGDTVMGWSTTMVSPPDGDMGALMATLRRLAARDDRLLLPGHGDPVTEPGALIAAQIAHREARVRQALAALAEAGPSDATTLAATVYADLRGPLMRAATRTLLATLVMLWEEGRVATDGQPAAGSVFRIA